MSNLYSSGIVLLIIILAVWMVWIYLYEKVVYTNNLLTKKYLFKKESIDINELVKIKYHYDAVVGFTSVWEFIDSKGKSLNIDGKARGLTNTLTHLESVLTDFSMTDFKKQFEAGDVVDTLDIWFKK